MKLCRALAYRGQRRDHDDYPIDIVKKVNNLTEQTYQKIGPLVGPGIEFQNGLGNTFSPFTINWAPCPRYESNIDGYTTMPKPIWEVALDK